MRRRDFITLLGGASVAWPAAARAQQPAKVWRIGIIVDTMRTPPYDGFLEGMRELGYVAGTDHYVEWRFANGRFVRIPGFVEELARLKVDVIFLGTSTMANAARQATRTIPIVMGYSTDPVGEGLVASLARPGGNVTGMASLGDPSARQLELLAAVVPGLARVALLRDPASAAHAEILERAQAAAQRAGLALVAAEARDPDDIDAAFAALARDRIQAVMVAADALVLSQPGRIAALARKHGLPSIAAQRDYAVHGGLMSCGEDLKDFYRRAASFVDRIFKGARPADLPIEQPRKFHLVVNRKTAAALDLAIRPQLYADADEVIE